MFIDTTKILGVDSLTTKPAGENSAAKGDSAQAKISCVFTNSVAAPTNQPVEDKTSTKQVVPGEAKSTEQPEEKSWFSKACDYVSDWWKGKDKVSTDGKDDGELSFGEKAESFGKGFLGGIVKSAVEHPIATGLTILGVAALEFFTAGAATPFIAAGFGAMSAYNIYEGVKEAQNAKTDGKAKVAYEHIGEGTFGVAASAGGLKIFKGTKGAKTNAKSSAKSTEPTAERTSANPKAPEPTNTATSVNDAATTSKPIPSTNVQTEKFRQGIANIDPAHPKEPLPFVPGLYKKLTPQDRKYLKVHSPRGVRANRYAQLLEKADDESLKLVQQSFYQKTGAQLHLDPSRIGLRAMANGLTRLEEWYKLGKMPSDLKHVVIGHGTGYSIDNSWMMKYSNKNTFHFINEVVPQGEKCIALICEDAPPGSWRAETPGIGRPVYSNLDMPYYPGKIVISGQNKIVGHIHGKDCSFFGENNPVTTKDLSKHQVHNGMDGVTIVYY